MKRQRIKLVSINTIGALGYLFCLLQWVWVIALAMPAVLNSDFVKQYTQKTITPPVASNPPLEISTAGIIFAAAVVIVMVLATIYICIKIPTAIGKTGEKITRKTTSALLPIFTHHKKIPKKRWLQLASRLLFITKILLCVIPLIVLLFVNNEDIALTRDIVIIIGAINALCSILIFCLQAASAKLLHISYKETW